MQGVKRNEGTCCPSTLSCVLSSMCPCTLLCACETIEPNTGMVILTYGRLSHVLDEPGLYCLNPCGTEATKLSLKERSLDLPNVEVADAKGSPVVLSAIINWKITDPVAAALEVESVVSYVKAMGMAVLKSVASGYPYESDDGHSLKGETVHIQEELVAALSKRVAAAGISVLRFSLTDLSYSSTVAGALLVKQSAEALVQARKLLVHGAVGIAHQAVERLRMDGTNLSPAEKAKVVTNLLSVVCGDSRVQPIITLS